MSGGETALIQTFLAPFGERFRPDVVVGPGSDCAATRVARGMLLVSKTDAVVEGVHFDLAHFAPEDVGWKALAVSLSDLAAAGARPRWFLCALGVPATPVAQAVARRMARGMAQLARRAECALVGGNVSRARDWSVTVTALGEAARPLTRGGARAGDAIVVCGRLGDAAAGLRAMRGARVGRGVAAALRAQRRPAPLLREGLAAAPFAAASVDVSDGFLRDLGHICEESAVGAEVQCERLPLGAAARALRDGLEVALTGGEDYALVWTVRRRSLARLLAAVPAAREVGRVVRGRAVRLFVDGRERPLPRVAGFDHLA